MARTRSNNPTEADHGKAIMEWVRAIRDRYPRRVLDRKGDPVVDPKTGGPVDALDLLAHVPNGIWTHVRVAKSFVAQGMRRAFPDYVWPVPSDPSFGDWTGLFLELKRAKPKARPRPAQEAFLAALANAYDPTQGRRPLVVVTYGVFETCRVIQAFGGYPDDATKWVPDDRPPSRARLDGVSEWGTDNVVVPW